MKQKKWILKAGLVLFIIGILVYLISYLRGADEGAWTKIGAVASIIGVIVTVLSVFIGNNHRTIVSKDNNLTFEEQEDKIIPEKQKQNNERFVFNGIYGSTGDIFVVNLINNSEYSVYDVNVTVHNDDICYLDNKDDFPIDKLSPVNGSFCVKLKRKSYRNEKTSKFLIDCRDINGFYSEVKSIDVSKYI